MCRRTIATTRRSSPWHPFIAACACAAREAAVGRTRHNTRVPSFRLPAFAEHVGIEIVETDKARVVGRIKLGPQHSNGGDRVHGGAIMTLADTLGAVATVLNLPPDTMTTTL